MNYDLIAQWIGYAVMLSSGLGFVLATYWFVADKLWRAWNGTLNWADLQDAVNHWKIAKPERYAKWEERNHPATKYD